MDAGEFYEKLQRANEDLSPPSIDQIADFYEVAEKLTEDQTEHSDGLSRAAWKTKRGLSVKLDSSEPDIGTGLPEELHVKNLVLTIKETNSESFIEPASITIAYSLSYPTHTSAFTQPAWVKEMHLFSHDTQEITDSKRDWMNPVDLEILKDILGQGTEYDGDLTSRLLEAAVSDAYISKLDFGPLFQMAEPFLQEGQNTYQKKFETSLEVDKSLSFASFMLRYFRRTYGRFSPASPSQHPTDFAVNLDFMPADRSIGRGYYIGADGLSVSFSSFPYLKDAHKLEDPFDPEVYELDRAYQEATYHANQQRELRRTVTNGSILADELKLIIDFCQSLRR